ncbi:MAG: divalent-cation tolerance protein CutA [Maricaulaceae bacterium]|jgi:periplasmic divalent cation tolerance protein
MGDTRFIYTTWPNPESAASAAREAVEKRHAACANVLPGAFSCYWWEGEVQSETEVVVIFKTSASAARDLRETVMRLHPYDEPAFVAIDVDESRSSREYLDWVKRVTK